MSQIALNRNQILQKYPNALLPQEGLQTKALTSADSIILLGGAAGACKTFTLFIASLRYIDNPYYTACFFRGAATSIFGAGGLWDTASKLYPDFGGKPNQMQKCWTFRSGAKIYFKNIDCRSPHRVKEELRGFQYNLGFFDEVTEIEEDIFWFTVGRCRDTGAKIPSQIYMTCNPNICWVKTLIEDVLDPDGYPIKEEAPKTRYFYRENGEIYWGKYYELMAKFMPKITENLVNLGVKTVENQGKNTLKNSENYPENEVNLHQKTVNFYQKYGLFYTENQPIFDSKTLKKEAKNYIQSFKFLPGTLEDNKILMKNDPSYKARLEALSTSDRLAMLYGCWNAQEDIVAFQKSWFNEYPMIQLPTKFDFVICTVDTATQKEKHSDFSCATVWGYVKPINELSTGQLYLIDMLHEKLTYVDLKNQLSTLICRHNSLFMQNTSSIYIEQANVGTALYHEFKREFNMLRLGAIDRHKNKFHRAREVQAFLERGGMYIPSDNPHIANPFIQEVCQFRFDGKHSHDDITDTMMDAIELCFLKKQYLRFQKKENAWNTVMGNSLSVGSKGRSRILG